VRPYLDFSRYPVTCPFGVQRPTVSNPGRTHEGQDHGCPRGTVLYAPEAGRLQLAFLRHSGADYLPSLFWPDGSWWPYSLYYQEWAGGIAILWGEKYTHVFLHLDPQWIYARVLAAVAMLTHEKRRKPGDYSGYVISEVVWNPWAVTEGDAIAVTGISGFDDGPHVHYQLMAPGKNAHTVLDPRSVWG
jgi:hypothetical protein